MNEGIELDVGLTVEETLEGMFFHGLKDGKISTQGVVKKAVGGYVILQYHSWLDGAQTNCKLFELDDLVGDVLFYDSEDDWKTAGDARMKEASLSPDSADQRNESPPDSTNGGGGD